MSLEKLNEYAAKAQAHARALVAGAKVQTYYDVTNLNRSYFTQKAPRSA